MSQLYIYPFSYLQLPIVSYEIKSKKIVPVLSESIYRNDDNLNYLINDDKNFIKNNSVSIDEMFKSLSTSNDYIFCNSDSMIHSLKYGVDISNRLTDLNLDYTEYLSYNNKKKIKEISKKSDIYVTDNINYINDDIINICNKNEKYELKHISIPIICITSLISEYGKSDLCLKLFEYYKKRNKKVDCIMTDSIYQILGLKSIDYDFLLSRDVDTAIMYINNYVYELSKFNDVLIMEVPYNLIKYDNKKIDTAGVFAYILSQSIRLDSTICCIPINNNNKKYYNTLEKIINERFGFKNIMFHLTNYFPVFNNRPIEYELPGVFLDTIEYNSCLEKLKGNYTNIFNIKEEIDLGILNY